MNTILTDDERKQLWKTELDMPNWRIDPDRMIRAAEAAVLAKLREQEPVKCNPSEYCKAQHIKLYAAPLPAVVQVPQGDDYIGGLEYRGNSVAYIHQKLTAYRTLIDEAWQAMRDAGRGPDGNTPLPDAIRAALAAPEAPAQGDPMDMPLPCDVKIGNGTHMKGTSLRTLVLRAQKLHEAAFGPAPTKEEAAANLERLRSVVNAPQAIPAPWREAVKRLRKNDAAGDTVFRCGFNAGIDAAIARIDALEGGE